MAGNKEEGKKEKRKHVQINQTKIGSSPSSSSSSSTREFPFTPLRSLVDEGFWHRLSFLKLNKYGIDDSPIPITGFYAPCTHSQVSNHLTLLAESFANDDEQSSMRIGNRNRCPVPGIIYNTNTWEDFRALDRKRLLKDEADKIWEDIRTGRAVEESSLLSRFLLISFADLKKWTFYYWFAFPALVLHPPAKLVGLKPASKWFTAEEAESVSAACNAWRSSIFTADVPFFLVSIASNSHATVRHLKDWEACQADSQKVLFGFYDPFHCQEKPGWPLCNLLALVCSRWNLNSVHFLCYKENRGFADMESSLVGEASMEIPQGWSDHQLIPNAVGWERNKDNKYAPRCINLAKSMDPIRLAITAANLNLQLMRWRQVPSLNIDKLTSMKCLILGAGALGCNVARLLMGWGVRKITLVDNGRVAMSNPLRQSLFTFNDCLNGGELKALAAARSLKEIFPAAEGEGVVMAIPMPGHPVTTQEENSVVDDCRRLHDLFDSHDAVFLLTDTRESQWLPSLLCASANKIAISVALGFDSFLAMRHGPGPFSSVHDLKTEDTNNLTADVGSLALTDRGGKRLGCYFCNDMVVPTNPTFNRTLYQQCTVTRPGLAALAAAYAVELFANLLQHPDGIFAVGYTENSTSSGSNEQPLGILPHQIRGSLYDFSLIKPVGHSSNSCTACCGPIVSEYRKKGMEFLLREINHPTYLGDLTGLTELKNSANSFELDRDKLPSTKCLLLGAGTLGCNVARLLMDCGVRKITLLDNGRVAMSNPLRQSLFTFNDCLNGGELKALAAARSLKHTFPAAEAEGVVMAIPMPGHPVTNQEENSVVGDCRRLHDLVDSHDVVFLLTDTRESRWLPSLLCASANKIAITAALGFDSFLAMRHGPGPFSSAHDLEAEAVNNLTANMASLALTDRGGKRLGCYFCNDVVAPTDSTSNRSLDQQCTVTRPGLAYMAAAVAVELFVKLLQHPDGIFAEGYTENHSSDNNEHPIGILPHQIRGSLYNFSQMKLVGHSSNSCTACCGTVVSEYRKRGMDFLLQAINHPTYLEDLTGLTELKKSANSFAFDWDNEMDDYGDDDCAEL